MPLYAAHCTDAPGSAGPREEYLAAHLAFVEANIARYRVAGPLRDADGHFAGALLVIEAEGAVEARAFMERDPYCQPAIWADLKIHAFNAAAGDWVGGVTW